jgi:uncharacterized damage-inducible protein DinB
MTSTSTGTVPATDNRPTPPEQGTERELLEGFLDRQRATAVYKATGLSDSDAARQLLPSITTVSGLIQHLADNERWWLRAVMDGQEDVEFLSTDEDPDGEFRVTADSSLAAIVADYEAAIRESHEVVAGHGLDELCVGRDSRFSLRWILLHLIEETARHCGHIDVLREQLDGATGE